MPRDGAILSEQAIRDAMCPLAPMPEAPTHKYIRLPIYLSKKELKSLARIARGEVEKEAWLYVAVKLDEKAPDKALPHPKSAAG